MAAGGAPRSGWRRDLGHLWGGANPAQPQLPLHSVLLHARPLSALGDSPEHARRPLGGSPDRAPPGGVPGAAARKRQRSGGWAAEPSTAETPATLAARCRRVGRRDMECEEGGRADAGAAAERAEPAGTGAAGVLAPAAAPTVVQCPRVRSCCENGGAIAEAAALPRPEEAGSMGAQTLRASPARQRACRQRERARDDYAHGGGGGGGSC